MTQPFIIHTDGAARGNPGPAAYAFVITPPDGGIIEESEPLGTATNNVAEYTAVVKALERVKELGARRVLLKSDSELMVKQMNGVYKVKNAGLLPLYQQARTLTRAFDDVRFQHVRREENTEADRLCNETLDGTRRSGLSPRIAVPELRVQETPEADAWQAARSEGLALLRAAAAAWAQGAATPTVIHTWNELLTLLERHGLLVDAGR